MGQSFYKYNCYFHAWLDKRSISIKYEKDGPLIVTEEMVKSSYIILGGKRKTIEFITVQQSKQENTVLRW